MKAQQLISGCRESPRVVGVWGDLAKTTQHLSKSLIEKKRYLRHQTSLVQLFLSTILQNLF